MKKGKVLITGGAGFIGSKLAHRLYKKGFELVVFDNLSTQIHGKAARFSSELTSIAECIKGSVELGKDWLKVPLDFDYVVHLAAETGTGQSMYEVSKYATVNVLGTSNLLEFLATKKGTVKRLVLSSTRAVYGEGAYSCAVHGKVFPKRSSDLMMEGFFDPICPICQGEIKAVGTEELAHLNPVSIYGITKLSQEQLIMNGAQMLDIPSIALRFQNVYGPGQSLKNPYTGLLSIFSTRMRKGLPVSIFEDGLESRDFVYIDDIVNSIELALEKPKITNEIFNIGNGDGTSVFKIAELLKKELKSESELNINGKFRIGDIRHNFAEISKAKALLGFRPNVSLDEGISNFVQWLHSQEIPEDKSEHALAELEQKGFYK